MQPKSDDGEWLALFPGSPQKTEGESLVSIRTWYRGTTLLD